MMRMPELCMDELKNEPYEFLIKERNRLLKKIRYFEKYKDELIDKDECSVTPSMCYGWNLRALATLCHIMEARFHEECEILETEEALADAARKEGYSGIRRLLNKFDNRNLYETYYDDYTENNDKLELKLYMDNDYSYVDEVPKELACNIRNSAIYSFKKPKNSQIEFFEFVRGGYSYPTQIYKYNHYKTKYQLYYSELEAYGFPEVLPSNKKLLEDYKSFETRILSIIKNWRYVDYRVNMNVMDGEWWEFKIKFTTGETYTMRGYNNFPENYQKLIKYLNKKIKI